MNHGHRSQTANFDGNYYLTNFNGKLKAGANFTIKYNVLPSLRLELAVCEVLPEQFAEYRLVTILGGILLFIFYVYKNWA